VRVPRKIAYDVLESPLGSLCIFFGDEGLYGVHFGLESIAKLDEELTEGSLLARDAYSCRDAYDQLREYFYDGRRSFDLMIDVLGTAFQRDVWSALQKIPYGEIRTYADIAVEIDNPKAVRAVGQANRRNQIPIVVPCHRVIGKDGSLVGYGGDHTDRKDWLLRHEGAY